MRSTTLLATVGMVLMLLTAMPMASVAASSAGTAGAEADGTDGFAVELQQTDENTTDNETSGENETLAPGERLTAIIGVQDAEFEGEIETRAYGIQVAAAATNDSKAGVIANNTEQVQERLAALEQRVAELKAQYNSNNSTISYGEYRSSVAPLYPQIRSLEQQLNISENESAELPADVLERNGVNVTAIQTLKNNAQNLSGQDVAEIARSIAGPNTGQGPPAGIPGGPGNNTPGAGSGSPGGPGGDMPGGPGGPGNDTGPGPDFPGNESGDDNTTDENTTVSQIVTGVTETLANTVSTIGGLVR